MQSWIFHYANKRNLIQAPTRDQAKEKFQERFGFWPSDDEIDIELSMVRPLS